MNGVSPVPGTEMERAIRLSGFNLDYTALQENFTGLATLTAKMAGTEIALISLVDTFTQWVIAGYGLTIQQIAREDSVCQYTILSNEYFEVNDLSADKRFKNNPYTTLRYYFGVPLLTQDGYAIGTISLLDRAQKEISPEKKELVKIIAAEIVSALEAIKTIQELNTKVKDASATRKKVAHDIRGPLGGIINLSQLINAQGSSNQMGEVLEFVELIHKSSSSLLEMADTILSIEKKTSIVEMAAPENEPDLTVFKEKMEKAYQPQATRGHIHFSVHIAEKKEKRNFNKKLSQAVGNLVSGAIHITPRDGSVKVELDALTKSKQDILQVTVTTTAELNQKDIDQVMNPVTKNTTLPGFSLVKHLTDAFNGAMEIRSKPGEGTIIVLSAVQSRI